MLKIIEVCLLSMLTYGPPLYANTSDDIGELPDERQVPRLVSMNYYKDSKTQMAFNWNTTYLTDTDLQVVKKDVGSFTSTDVIEYVGTVSKSQVNEDGFIHRVVAENLDEGETYLYRVGDKELDNWSDVGEFKTVEESESVTFMHISDPQVIEESDSYAYSELLKASIETSDPQFIMIAGDIVNNSWAGRSPQLEQWEWAITNQKEYLKNIPVMSVAGNHEAADYDFASRYNLPHDDGIDTLTGVYYSFDYNDIHFTCLNSNDSSSEEGSLRGLSDTQLNWIKNDLEKSKDAKWKVVMLHKGLYDAGSHCSNIDGEDGDIPLIRAQLSPLFTEYNVDMVLQGHDHLYSRSYPIEGQIVNNELKSLTNNEEKVEVTREDTSYSLYKNPEGPIYLNTGSASGSKYYSVVAYDQEVIPLEKAYGAMNKMYTEFTIENNSLYANVYEIIDGEASLYDTFGIIKVDEAKPGNNNTVIITISIIGGALLVAAVIGGIIILKKKGVKKNG